MLVGMAGRLEDHELRDLAADVRRWHNWVAVLTGWKTPIWRPYEPCPLCDQRRGLRVDLDKQAAYCSGCGETWSADDGSILLLADYIRGLGLVMPDRSEVG
jgi:hypothetical protein